MLIKCLIYKGNFITLVNRRNYCLIRDLHMYVWTISQIGFTYAKCCHLCFFPYLGFFKFPRFNYL